VDRLADFNSNIARWAVHRETSAATFGRQALGMVWDYCETVPLSDSTGSLTGSIEWVCRVCEGLGLANLAAGHTEQASASAHPLPDDSAPVLFTDPPYYDAVPYANLSDFFYVWIKRSLKQVLPDLFIGNETPKNGEAVQLSERNPLYAYKTKEYFERLMFEAFANARRYVQPSGCGVIVFAHKSTSAWETLLSAVVNAGWVVTASWSIDTEWTNRLRARDSATLASSVHLVCRPRENPDGSLRTEDVGEWRDVLQELPKRIHEWLPRLTEEGIVGADAIFACLGPALEVYSRYSRVERSDGSPVTLRDYLVEVWAAVAKEALSLLFRDADASGLEPDARLTAMWLWTLRTGTDGNGSGEDEAEDEVDADDEEASAPSSKGNAYILEFDAALKIARGLGANLDTLKSVVEVKGQTARLRSVAEREAFLFDRRKSPLSAGQPKPMAVTAKAPSRGRSKRPAPGQQSFAVTEEDRLTVQPALSREARADVSPSDETAADWTTAETVLDRVHQAMLLFAKGRSDALKRFLVDDGVGKEARFWKLAQSLSALYPPGTEEKRWVDGVLARKKGLGF
jgi:hypothetical protein